MRLHDDRHMIDKRRRGGLGDRRKVQKGSVQVRIVWQRQRGLHGYVYSFLFLGFSSEKTCQIVFILFWESEIYHNLAIVCIYFHIHQSCDGLIIQLLQL